MLFNSVPFWLFFVVVAAMHFALPKRVRWLLLLVASYAFYMSWNPAYAILILTSTVVDYVAAIQIARSQDKRRRRAWLWLSLGTNLGLLFTFKYANFAMDSVGALLGWAEVSGGSWRIVDVLLPVGISFYTFQTLSYTIDVYRGGTQPERHFGYFALFVSFFPQLVAGPIERARNLLPQLHRPRPADAARMFSGVQLMFWGLFKKVVVADRCAIYVDPFFANPDAYSGAATWTIAYLFSFQIYCDFSGYSDIAIGCARVFGVDLMENFRRPFFSRTIAEFWQRWHISLLNWLRDYVYLPLALRRRDAWWTYFSMFVLMTASGLWHGAAWTFVLWGVAHGLLVGASRFTLGWRDRAYAALGVPGPLVVAIRIFITFHLFCATMVLFRAESVRDAFLVLGRLATNLPSTAALPGQALVAIAVLVAVEVVQERGAIIPVLDRLPFPLRFAVYYGVLLAIVLLGVDQGTPFIYFQF